MWLLRSTGSVLIVNTADFCTGYSSDQRSFSLDIAVLARETALFIDEKRWRVSSGPLSSSNRHTQSLHVIHLLFSLMLQQMERGREEVILPYVSTVVTKRCARIEKIETETRLSWRRARCPLQYRLSATRWGARTALCLPWKVSHDPSYGCKSILTCLQ